MQGDVDHEGVKAAVRYLDGLVEEESKEVPISSIVVGGFSQVSALYCSSSGIHVCCSFTGEMLLKSVVT